jgi:hypothetical protein
MEHFDTKLKEFLLGFSSPIFSPTESDHESPKHLFFLKAALTHVTNHCSKDVLHHWHGANSMHINPVLDVRFCSYVWIGLLLMLPMLL